MQGTRLPPLVRTLSQLEKQDYLLHSTPPYDRRIRLLALTAQGRARLGKFNRMIETYQYRITCTIPEAGFAFSNATLN